MNGYEVLIRNFDNLSDDEKTTLNDDLEFGIDGEFKCENCSWDDFMRELMPKLETLKNLKGGAPAEMPDAFGKDYFDTEADALKAEW